MTKATGAVRRAVPMAVPMVAAVVLGLVAWSSPAESQPEYLSEFNSHYDTRGSRLDTCQTCHTGASGNKNNVNPYGTDWAGAGYDFAAVEGADSDGDGFSNIDEINAETFPGDPADNPDTQAKPEPPPSTTTTTTQPSPLPGLPPLPIG